MPDEKPVKKPVMGRNGGTLYPGGVPGGNKGGTGRPPSELRARMRSGLDAGLELVLARLNDPDLSSADLAKFLDFCGKYGLGPAAVEQVAPEGEAIRLTMDARVKHDDETSD